MSTATAVEDTILIRNKKIPVKICELEQKKLIFYAENPRIYSLVRVDNSEPTQDEIEEKLQSLEHVRILIQDIKENGGLIDPIIVKDGTFEVLEGNSRLAAYRWLFEKDPIKWGLIRCVLLPSNIHDDDVFALLGQYHIKGKKDWAPYEQAGFLYRRYKNHGISLPELGKELGIGWKRVSQLIEIYEFMITHKDTEIKRWSYYEQFIKSNKIKKMREKFPTFDKKFAKDVKAGNIGKAVDVREKLQKFACGKDKDVAKFVQGEISFDDACEQIESSGSSDTTYRKLSRFRQWLASKEAEEAIMQSPPKVKKKVLFEISKLATLVVRVSKKFNGDQE